MLKTFIRPMGEEATFAKELPTMQFPPGHVIDTELDTNRSRLIRIERKLDAFGEIICVLIGFGAACGAYVVSAEKLDLGEFYGGLAAFIVFGLVGATTWRTLHKE